MKTKLMLTIGGVWYLIEGISVFFTTTGFYFMSYGFGFFCIALGLLFMMTRSEAPSRLRNTILFIGFLSSLGISLLAYYAQWSGAFLDSAFGYITATLWLIIAIGFFLARRAKAFPSVRNLQ
jgi:hypothetical protein